MPDLSRIKAQRDAAEVRRAHSKPLRVSRANAGGRP